MSYSATWKALCGGSAIAKSKIRPFNLPGNTVGQLRRLCSPFMLQGSDMQPEGIALE